MEVSIANMLGQDQVERRAHSLPPNIIRRYASPVPGAQSRTNAPQRSNVILYLARERIFAQSSTPEQRLIAAGIDSASSTRRDPANPEAMTPGPLPGPQTGGGPPREVLSQQPLVFHGEFGELDNSGTRHIIRQSYDDSLFQNGPRNGRNDYNEMMWTRFRHEYSMREAGLAERFSDAVMDWILRVLQNELDDYVTRLRADQSRSRARRN